MDKFIQSIELIYGKDISFIEEFDTGNYGTSLKVLIDGKTYVMKIIPRDETGRIEVLLPILKHINQQGVSVPGPIVTDDGRYMCQTLYNGKEMSVYVYPLLEGKNLENLFDKVINKGYMYDLGKELANLHKSMNEYDECIEKLPSWENAEGLFVIYEEIHKDIPNEVIAMYDKYISELKAANLKMNQLIHGDMHMANIVVDKLNSFKFIDMEECMYGNCMMDIAILVFDIPVVCSDETMSKKGIQDLLRGYNSVNEISFKESSTIPLMLKILEVASYINYYRYKDSSDIWLHKFYNNREERILNQETYFEYN